MIATLVPDVALAWRGGAIGLAAGLLFATLAGRAVRQELAVPYTRKIFHFGIFTVAAGVYLAWGLDGTNAYGAVVAAIVLVAVARKKRSSLYGALARETDAPRESTFIVVPLVTTALGGLLSALVAGPFAPVGYLVSGWGDAVGEPVGERWGKHPYRVPSMLGVPAKRTLEGSAAVLVVGSLGAIVALIAGGTAPATALGVGLVCGAVGAIVEALSTHGLDNLTVQVAASGTAWLLLH